MRSGYIVAILLVLWTPTSVAGAHSSLAAPYAADHGLVALTVVLAPPAGVEQVADSSSRRAEGVVYDSAGTSYMMAGGKRFRMSDRVVGAPRNIGSSLGTPAGGLSSKQKGILFAVVIAVIVVILFIFSLWDASGDGPASDDEGIAFRSRADSPGSEIRRLGAPSEEPGAVPLARSLDAEMQGQRQADTEAPGASRDQPAAPPVRHGVLGNHSPEETEATDEREVQKTLRSAARWAFWIGIAQFAVIGIFVFLAASGTWYGDEMHPLDALGALIAGSAMIYWSRAIKRGAPKARRYLLYLILLCSFFALTAFLTQRPANLSLNVFAILAFVYARRALPEQPSEPAPPADADSDPSEAVPDEEPKHRRYSVTLDVAKGASRQEPAPPSTPTHSSTLLDTLRQLATLRDEGIITAEEFDAKKQDLLGRL